MNVEVSGAGRPDVDESELSRFAASMLERELVDGDSTLSVTFIDSGSIARLNEQHMSKEGPTDVLSFPIEDAAPGRPPTRIADGPPLELGDIFICEEVVDAHASEYEVPFSEELYLMVAHGVLHILGWDHRTQTEAEAMEMREAEHLATIGQVRR
jgi:probable rRNA maturation factor